MCINIDCEINKYTVDNKYLFYLVMTDIFGCLEINIYFIF